MTSTALTGKAGREPISRIPAATGLLALALAGVWLATELAGGSTNPEVLHRFGMRRALWGFSEHPGRLLSSMLLHYGPVHLAANLLSLVVVGSLVERRSGWSGMLFVFFFAGLAGGLASLHWSPQTGTLGASGGIFGLAGALLILHWRHPLEPGRGGAAVTVMLGLLLAGLAGQARSGGQLMDQAAHLGGLAGGCLAALALRPRLDWRLALPLGALLACQIYAETSRGPRL